jgi:hypothetical protein
MRYDVVRKQANPRERFEFSPVFLKRKDRAVGCWQNEIELLLPHYTLKGKDPVISFFAIGRNPVHLFDVS